MNYWLIAIPFIAAFIGWFANWMLIKMLFRPRKPRKITGIALQGIFPQKQQQIAEKLGRVVSAEFLSSWDIEKKISDPENLEKILPLIDEHVDDFLRNKLKEQIPMLGMFIGDKTISTLKTVFMRELEILFPLIMQKFAGNLKNELNLEKMITEKIAHFSIDKLEKIFYASLSKELRFIGIIGAVTGFVVGMIQVVIVILTS